MNETKDVKKYNEYEEFNKKHYKGHFMQSREWANVKDNWTNEVVIIKDENQNIKGTMSLLIRKVPFFNSTIMYCPRGPVCNIDDTTTLEELITKVKVIAKKYNSYVLKIDPDIKSTNLEYIENMKKLGFKIKSSTKNFEGIQPRYVFRLNIKDKTEDDLLKIFHSKTRYNIRLAARKGVEVKLGTRSDLAEFHNVMNETGSRDNFVIRSLEYFEKMYDCLAPNHLRLYLAYYEGKIIAGTIPILYGDKCWYLYGASSNEHRKVMPNYLLQWEMIKWALENKCSIYDFRGVSGDLSEENPLYGLYKFKKGFNGEFTEFIGEMNYIFNPVMNFAVENGEKSFRNLRKKVYTIKSK